MAGGSDPSLVSVARIINNEDSDMEPLKGQPRGQVVNPVQEYLDARPQEKAEIRTIRQPLADLRNGCGIGADATPNDMPMAQRSLHGPAFGEYGRAADRLRNLGGEHP